MRGRAVLMAMCGALVAVLFVSVSTAGDVQYFERYPSLDLSFGQPDGVELEVFQIEAEEENPDVFKIWEIDLPDTLATVFQVLALAGLAALLIFLWTRRPRLAWRRNTASEPFEVFDDLSEQLAADVASQRHVLATGTPRNAIVACWLRLEALTAAAGFERDPADTSEEATTRILSAFSVDVEAVEGLAALYREARFSTHDMGEEQRSTALDCLDAIHASLRTGAPA